MRALIISEYEYGNGAANAAHRLAFDLVRTERCDVFYVYLYGRGSSPKTPGVRKECIEGETSWLDRIIYRIFFRLHERITKPSWIPPWVKASSREQILRRCYDRNFRLLKRLLIQFEPDVISIHNCSLMLDHGAVWKLSHCAPVFWTMHDCHAATLSAYSFIRLDGNRQIDPSRQLYIQKRRFQELANSRTPIHFIAPSAWMARIARSRLKKRKPVTVIHYGLREDDYFPLNKSDAESILGIGASRNHRVLVVASNLNHVRKNFALVLQAAELLRGEPVEFLAIGSAPEGLRREASGIRFLGAMRSAAELRAAYSAADVHVIPSLADNLPNTVIESLFCGTPVAGARVGGIPEMVVPGKTGWLFDPYQPEELADLLASLAARREEVAALASDCREWAVERFGAERQAAAYTAVFRRAIDEFRERKC